MINGHILLSELTPIQKRCKIRIPWKTISPVSVHCHKKKLNLKTQQKCMLSMPTTPPPKRIISINPIALRKAKIACNFGLSECNRVNTYVSLLLIRVASPETTLHFETWQALYNSHPRDSIKVAVVGRLLLWRNQIYSKTALCRYLKLAVIGRWLLLSGDGSWRFHCTLLIFPYDYLRYIK